MSVGDGGGSLTGTDRPEPASGVRALLVRCGVLPPERAAPARRGLPSRLCWLVCGLPFAAALAAVVAALVDGATLKSLADGLAPDGTAEHFTAERIAGIQQRLVLAAVAWALLGALACFLRWRFAASLQDAVRGVLHLPADLIARVRRADRTDRVHLAVLAALTLFAAWISGRALTQPMRVDEAASYLHYIRRPVPFIATAYNATNNHILHNLLAHVCFRLWGSSEWAVRLPAWLFGVASLPVAYAAARAHFGRTAALATVAVLATSPYYVDSLTNARGYPLLQFFFLAQLVLLPRIVRGEPRAWLLFVLAGALGLYAVPVMAVPLAICGIWLAWAGVAERERLGLAYFFRVGVAYAAIGALAAFLYSPAQVVGSVAGVLDEQRRFGRHPDRFDTLTVIGMKAREIWSLWVHGRPAALTIALGACAAAALLVRRAGARPGVRLLVATVVGWSCILAVVRAFPPFWTLGFLYLLFVPLACAGAVLLLQLVRLPERARDALVVAAAVVAACAFTPALRATATDPAAPWYVGYEDAPAVASEILPEVRTGVHVDPEFILATPLNYYLQRGLGRDVFAVAPMWDHRGAVAPESLVLPVPDRLPRRLRTHMVDAYLAELAADPGYVESAPRRRAGATTIITLALRPHTGD